MEITDRVLSMLYQYLLSNQHLQLDKTFQIYFKILSIEHSKYKQSQPKKNVQRKLAKLHVGDSTRKYQYKWSIDFPKIEPFINHCLLMCSILALAQLEFFESNKTNKKFLYLALIKSKLEAKQNYAKKLMLQQLNNLFSVTS